MSYYEDGKPPVGVPPQQYGYPPQGYPQQGGYPPQGYPQEYQQGGYGAYPQQQGPMYAPQQQYQQQNTGPSFAEGCLAALCCCCLCDFLF